MSTGKLETLKDVNTNGEYLMRLYTRETWTEKRNVYKLMSGLRYNIDRYSNQISV